MKKQILTILMAAILVSGFTACGNDNVTGPSLPDGGSENGTAERERYLYGEVKIPDIHCEDADSEGRAGIEWEQKLQQLPCLDSMVFETHTLGDYTIRLVGDRVRADETNFPGSIYTTKLRVEIEKNGVKIEGDGRYNDIVLYAGQQTEYRLFADKIGSYLDVYDMEYPVVAMRYYFEDSTERLVAKAVEFSTIQDGEAFGGFVGIFEKDTGITLNSNADASKAGTLLATNSENGARCRVGICSGDEFVVVDKKTLEDKEAGIRYTFQFSNPPQGELYTAGKIK